MKKKLMTVLLCLALLPAFGQMTDWRGEFHLGNFASYDYDLKRWTTNALEVYTTVVIDIGSSGSGRLIIYVGGDKRAFTIESAIYEQSLGQMTMTCLNPQGYRLKAYGVCNSNTCIQALILDNNTNNTALVYFYENANLQWTRRY